MGKLPLAAAACLLFAGCSGDDQPAPPKRAPEKTLKQIDPAAYQANSESAMAEIPAADQPRFMRLFVCEVKKNSLGGSPKPIDASYIRQLYAYFKANPTAADNCAA